MIVHTVLIVLIVHTNISAYIIHPFVRVFSSVTKHRMNILCIFSGLQQKQEDLCLVNESPYQNEDVNNVQTLTNRGTYVCTYEL